MKIIIFLLMFAPLSAFVGLLVGLLFWSTTVGFVTAGWMLAFSADVCFNSNHKEPNND